MALGATCGAIAASGPGPELLESTELDGLGAFNADQAALLGNSIQIFGHLAEIGAWNPTGRAKGAATHTIEHADFPELARVNLEEVLGLVEPQQFARLGQYGLVFRGQRGWVKIAVRLGQAHHDLWT